MSKKEKEVIVTFLPKSTLETVNKDVESLIQRLDADLPDYSDQKIILITNQGLSLCKKVSHARILATQSPSLFDPKRGIDYIIVDNNCPQKRNLILEAFSRKNILPVKSFEMTDNGIKEVA